MEQVNKHYLLMTDQVRLQFLNLRAKSAPLSEISETWRVIMELFRFVVLNYLAVMQTVKSFDSASIINIAPAILPMLRSMDFCKSEKLILLHCEVEDEVARQEPALHSPLRLACMVCNRGIVCPIQLSCDHQLW